jgi:outer membrane protein W
MRFVIVAATVLASTAVSATALAGDGAIELGLRTGYALPLGQSTGGGQNGSTDLSKSISGKVPLWIDAGYKINPNIYVGAFFEYGFGILASNASFGGATCGQNGVSCSANDIIFGVDALYHISPAGPLDPFVGLGIGYETLGFNASEGGQSGSVSLSGFQFVNLQAGADYKVTPDLGIGPFVAFSLGQFSGCSFGGAVNAAGSCSIPQQAMHEWLTFGIRGAYDIHL